MQISQPPIGTPLPGGGANVTGALVVGTNTLVPNPALVVNGPTASNRLLAVETAGLLRWTFGASTGAETGGDAGSDFVLNSYTDAGGVKMTPFNVNRSTGSATFSQPMNITAQLTISGAPNGLAITGVGLAAGLTLGNIGTGPIIRAGAGVPSDTQPKGSIWIRNNGSVGAMIYISAGGGTWNAIAGV